MKVLFAFIYLNPCLDVYFKSYLLKYLIIKAILKSHSFMVPLNNRFQTLNLKNVVLIK